MAADAAGEEVYLIWPGDTVYALGAGFPFNTEVDLYVVRSRDIWSEGDTLRDVTGEVDVVWTDHIGNLWKTEVWSSARPGEYNIVVDVNRNGLYDRWDAMDRVVRRGVVVHSKMTIFTANALDRG